MSPFQGWQSPRNIPYWNSVHCSLSRVSSSPRSYIQENPLTDLSTPRLYTCRFIPVCECLETSVIWDIEKGKWRCLWKTSLQGETTLSNFIHNIRIDDWRNLDLGFYLIVYFLFYIMSQLQIPIMDDIIIYSNYFNQVIKVKRHLRNLNMFKHVTCPIFSASKNTFIERV